MCFATGVMQGFGHGGQVGTPMWLRQLSSHTPASWSGLGALPPAELEPCLWLPSSTDRWPRSTASPSTPGTALPPPVGL